MTSYKGEKRRAMLVAQHELFTENIVKLVDIDGRSIMHTVTLLTFYGKFKLFGKMAIESFSPSLS
jgi:hypothetical protein